eukprot:g2265.t1
MLQYRSDPSSFEEKRKAMEEFLPTTRSYWLLKQLVKEYFIQSIDNLEPENMEKMLRNLTTRFGVEQKLFACIQRHHELALSSPRSEVMDRPLPPLPQLPFESNEDYSIEPLEIVRKARVNFEANIFRELKSLIESRRRGPIPLAAIKVRLSIADRHKLKNQELFVVSEKDNEDDIELSEIFSATKSTKSKNTFNVICDPGADGFHGDFPAARRPSKGTERRSTRSPSPFSVTTTKGKKKSEKSSAKNGKLTYPFDSEDLLEIIANLNSTNLSKMGSNICKDENDVEYKSDSSQRKRIPFKSFGLVQILLKIPGLNELRNLYSELNPSMMHFGVDEKVRSTGKLFAEKRRKQLVDILSKSRMENSNDSKIQNFVQCLRKFIRRGCPPSDRFVIWKILLDSCENDQSLSIEKLKKHFSKFFHTKKKRNSESSSKTSSHIQNQYKKWNLRQGWSTDTDSKFINFWCDTWSHRQNGIGGLAPSTATKYEKEYFQLLLGSVDRWRFPVIDALFSSDVRKTMNNEMYFVFEDIIRSAIAVFSRDPLVYSQCVLPLHRPIYATEGKHHHRVGSEGKEDEDERKRIGLVPPCGVLPFAGLSFYCAPLAFITDCSVSLYFVFRSMFTRYWCQLNSVSSKKGSLLWLCRLFEELLLTKRPTIYTHLVSLGVHPLQLAFPWIRFAFVQYLEVEQVLILWDRIFGYDELTILPIMAAAIFMFRAETLLQCENVREVQDTFADSSTLQVVPLLQQFLFGNS